jgi:hypothetical protein
MYAVVFFMLRTLINHQIGTYTIQEGKYGVFFLPDADVAVLKQ